MDTNPECRGSFFGLKQCEQDCFISSVLLNQYGDALKKGDERRIRTIILEAVERGCPNGAELINIYVNEP